MNFAESRHALVGALETSGSYVAMLGLRIILAWEFFEAGLMKFQGSNWFAHIKGDFPFPFNVVPTEISWTLATYTELVGGVAILLGLGTRFFSFALIILTIVATAAVHWPGEWSTLSELLQGYSVSDKGFGNYKLPVIYLAMFLPLLFLGPGRLSIDHLISRLVIRNQAAIAVGMGQPARGT
ncbi:MAG: DoxX family protein [Rubricoccaceae bacterium]|nr:DoxX family protein [Rubricoccaceae bacterium]